MPVNYNAFNVDPLPYQQAAMGNFRNAMALRDQRNQDAEMNAMRAQQQQDLQGQRQAQNAFNDRQQVDLQGQRQAQNALGQQQVAETAKRTEVMKQNAKMSSIGTALKLGWEAGGGEASRKVFSGTMAAAGYGDEFGPDSPWVPKFEKDGIGELPIGKGPNGLPEGILTIDGTDKEREAFTDAWIKDPTIVQDQKRLMQAAQDSGVKIGYKKGWSESKKEPKEDTFTKKRMEGFANTLNDIDATLAKGSRVDESGVEVPLGDLERGRLMLAKHELQNQVRRSRGEKPIELFKSPEDVRGWFKAGLITKDEAKGEIAKKGWNIGEDKKASKKEEKKASSGDFSKEGADNPISKIINEFSLSSSNFFKDWNEKRRRAARRLSEEAEARKAAQK